MSDTEDLGDETLQTFEEQQRRKEQKLQEEMEEYRAMRASEKDKEANDIEELKRKKKERQQQRAEEEKRMTVQRKEEEARRKVEEEERKKKKAEDEERRRREKERRRLEAEKRKGPKTPNFTIVKKEGSKDEDEVEKKPQKTKEDLEREKQAALSSRITPLADTNELSTDQLIELATNLHEQIRNLVSNMYDTEDRYKRQQYDIVELQERARAQSKTKKKGISAVQYDDSYDRMNDRFSNAPPKILVANKYEAKLDRRPWNERLDQFSKEDLVDISKMYNDYIESNYLTGGY
ncbi:Troponin T [Mactra antiquata]